ncbi:hypothetical protein [Microbacterium sp. SORGH_AS_0862]|uniref:hypothetical protein n=1 Tax=Microbacterium sp. SORGH_AS_0862 TaxID=3041789 RepID=UPI002791ECAA|nr:hypothetical protein [Microbacterium sp. SORGH_AS_0862]MDQ1206203.1 hypothetical protein [Microbacterium sp. SORGH_AS_0862]
MSFPASFFFPHIISIRALAGGAGMGETYADAVPSIAEVKDEAQLVRTADGAEVTSSTQVTVPLDTAAPLGSLVTVWAGQGAQRESVVLRVARDENPPPLPSHLILYLE